MFKLKVLSIAFSAMALVSVFMPVMTVSAQVETASGSNLICTVFPFIRNIGAFGISNLCTGLSPDTAGSTIRATFNLIVSLIFVAIIIFSIYVIIKAAIKYIRSEGDPAKIEEAQKAIKSVFVGIAALFIGLIGIIIILAFFNVSNVGTVDSGTELNNPLLQNILAPQ